MKYLMKATSAAALLCIAAGATAATTGDATPGNKMAGKGDAVASKPYDHSDRTNISAYTSDRDALQAKLKPGHDIATYRKQLGDMGFQVTAVNDRDTDYVEYEVVKGRNSYEVQIDLDKATNKATKVDVAPNLWRASSTKAALKGNDYEPVTTADYSDRAYVKGWTEEKAGLEKALGTGHDKAYYASKLKQMGYSVTAVNDREADYLEYEVVKANRTYEVQVDFDKATGKSSKVDVTTNMWNADATDKALDTSKR